jgi:beta-lactamase superfamily II metal-dependent hydrolase
MFRIEMLPAERGDALWITYGSSRRHHVLVDAGPLETIPTLVPELERRIAALPGDTDRVDLFVVTHIDADHIQGAVSLLSDAQRVPLFADIWFNGWKHHHRRLKRSKMLGGPDAERFTHPLLEHPKRWNAAFGGGAVVVPSEGNLPTAQLPGGMKITLLAPDMTAMTRLVPEWGKACLRAGIDPGGGAPIVRKSWRRDRMLGTAGFDPDQLAASRFYPDRSRANAAGIAFIAEYDKKRVLFAADCPAKSIIAGLDRLTCSSELHKFAAVKIAHHGSRANTNLELCRRISSPKWLVSTNGAKFEHPDAECLARIIVTQKRPTFYLNYETDHVSKLIAHEGERYSVQLPHRNRDGTLRTGITVPV